LPKKQSKDDSSGHKHVSWWVGILAGFLLAGVVMLGGRTGALYELENKSYDNRFIWRGPVPVDHSEVIIVDIDDETFTSLPHGYPFPRDYHAKLIENLFNAGAKLIVYDVQFMEPKGHEGDSILAAVTEKYSDRLIHAAKIAFEHDSRISHDITRAMLPIDEIASTGVSIGVVNQITDRDGFTRQYPIYVQHQNRNYLPLAMKAFQLIYSMPDTTSLVREKNHINFGLFSVPVMANVGEGDGSMSTMLINHLGPIATLPTYHFSDVMDTEDFDLFRDDTDYMRWFTMSDEQFSMLEMLLPAEAVQPFRDIRANNPFKDKIVFVGASAAELQDLKFTPFYSYKNLNRETPGVEVHAQALQTLLDRSFIANASSLTDYLIIAFLIIVVFLVNNSTKLIFGTPLTILLAILYTFFAYYMFIYHKTWIAISAPILGITVAYLSTTVYRYILEQREKAMIKGMFAQYVPQKVVSELIANPDMLKLGGERRRMTALFTDVAGFTTVSEKLSPEELVSLLNEYLSEMSNIVLEHEGIIDKYEGDLIMAEWGAPVFYEEHAEFACRAALVMQKRLAELRVDWQKRGIPELYSRVGINTGAMIVGNMGCLEVFDYTVMGDAVNLASRLEGANKSYSTTIMIGPETYHDVKDIFVTRMLDDLIVKGKDEPVRVYELIEEKEEDVPSELLELLPIYNEGLELYAEMRFEEAIEKFNSALELVDDDGPSITYLKRCEYFRDNPPGEDWDRVFELTEK
jgi:adenylate cyclase